MDENLKLRKLKLLQEKAKLQEGLPHLYGFPFYAWARAFFETINKNAILRAGNQLSKSSTQIRKHIHWATSPEKWRGWWDTPPRQFWYLYPSKDVATIEFEKKWIPEFMPRREFKDHPKYGWNAIFKYKQIHCIHWHSGVTTYFKTYMQDADNLQTGTIHKVDCFVAGTLVKTPNGLRPIETISVGDSVLGLGGYNKVCKTFKRQSELHTVNFSKNTATKSSTNVLTGSPEHPIWVDGKGWVRLGDLSPGDQLLGARSWNTQKKLFSLKAAFTTGFQTIKTIAQETILEPLRDNFTLIFGRPITSGMFQRATLSTTSTSFPQTTELRIFSFLPERSTHEFTKNTSGRVLKNKNIHVDDAKKNSSLGHLGSQQQDFALGVVGGFLFMLGAGASGVLSLLRQGQTQANVSVVRSAPIEQLASVYNLTVSGNHTYFANGVLTHNCDEETPFHLWPELNMRRSRTNGYFSMVYTPTLGEPEWRDLMEGRGGDFLKDAWKKTVSLLECQYYEDGSASPWTTERINQIINSCSTQSEIDRRVHGKNVAEGGLKYPSFDRTNNVKPPEAIPHDWMWYAGVDIGGGGTSHPGSIVFLVIAPDGSKGRVVKGWRGDKSQNTTAQDILNRYRHMKQHLIITHAAYDSQSKDFFTFATNVGEPFQKAIKDSEAGRDILNTLFKNQMLVIDDIPELEGLVDELETLMLDTAKSKARDDFIDGLRFAAAPAPWDWTKITSEYLIETPKKVYSDLELRQGKVQDINEQYDAVFGEEIEAWNELYDS